MQFQGMARERGVAVEVQRSDEGRDTGVLHDIDAIFGGAVDVLADDADAIDDFCDGIDLAGFGL